VGFCDEFGLCHPIIMPDQTLCNDDNACTHSDGCRNGVCTGLATSCSDNDPCTSDECDPATGCFHLDLDTNGCGTLAPGSLPTPAPTPLTYLDNEPVVVLPASAPPPPDNQQASIILNGDYDEPEEDNNDGDEVARGETENEVLENPGLNWGASIVGLGFVACAGCLAMFAGAIATNKRSMKDDDRLEEVLLANDTTIDMNAVVENDAFQSAA